MFVLVPQSLWPLLFNQEDDRHFRVVDLAHSERCGWQLERSEMFEPFVRLNSKCFLWPGNERPWTALKLQTGVSRHRIFHFGSCCWHQNNNSKTQTAARSPTVGATTKKEKLSVMRIDTPMVWEWTSMEVLTGPIKTLGRMPASCEQIKTVAEKLLFGLCAVVSLTIRDWQWGSTSPAFVLPERTWAEQKKSRATKVEVWWTFTKTHTQTHTHAELWICHLKPFFLKGSDLFIRPLSLAFGKDSSSSKQGCFTRTTNHNTKDSLRGKNWDLRQSSRRNRFLRGNYAFHIK